MGNVIDQRIVEMQFDNKEFERNVQTSIKSLDNLKKSLDLEESAKSFKKIDEVDKKFNLNGVSGAISEVHAKFSAWEVAGITAIQRVTNTAITYGERMVKSLTVDQLVAGWDKYSQKTQSVQTIMNSTGKSVEAVNGYLEKLQWFSDETSYSFTNMTDALGKFTSSGANIDTIIPVITGIANATAFAGQGANEFQRVLYNLNQAYSSGYLQLMDWKSVENANVASAQLKQSFIDAAKALGILSEEGRTAKGTLVDISTFNMTLSEKWLSTEVMEKAFSGWSEYSDAVYDMVRSGQVDTASEAMERLSGKFSQNAETAFEAAQQAKSFNEAIDATKDAVSSNWARTWEIIFGNKEQATKLWTDLSEVLWDIFASGGEQRNALLSDAMVSGWDKVTARVIETGHSVEEFEEALRRSASKQGIPIGELEKKYGSLQDVFTSGMIKEADSTDILKSAISSLSKETEIVTQDAVSYTVRNGDTLYGIADRFGTSVDELLRLNSDLITDPNMIYSGQVFTITEAVTSTTEATEDLVENFDDLWDVLTIGGGRDMMIESLFNIIEAIRKPFDAVRKGWEKVFPSITSSQLNSAIEGFRDFTKSLIADESTLDKITRIFSGLFSILGIGIDIFSALWDVITPLFNMAGDAGGGLLSFIACVGDGIVAFREFLNEGNVFGTIFGTISVWIQNGITAIRSFFSEFTNVDIITPLSESWNKFVNWIKGIFKKDEKISVNDKIKNIIREISRRLYKCDLLKEGITIATNIVSGLVVGLKHGVKKVVTGIISLATNMVDAICDFLGIHSPATTFIDIAMQCINGLINGFIKFGWSAIDAIVKMLGSIIVSIINAIGTILGKDLLELFGNLYDTVCDFVVELFTGVERDAKKSASNSGTSIGDRFVSGISQAFISVVDFFKRAGKWISDVFNNYIMPVVRPLFEWLKVQTDNFDIMKILDIFKTYETIKLFDALSSYFKDGGFLSSISGFFTSLTESISKFGQKTAGWADAIKSIAIAIALLAGSVFILSKVDDADLTKAMRFLRELALLLGGIIAVVSLAAARMAKITAAASSGGGKKKGFFSKLIDGLKPDKLAKRLSALAKSVIAMSIAVLILSKAVERLGKMDPQELTVGIVAVGVLMTELAIAARIAGKTSKVGDAMVLIGLVLGLKLLITTLDDINKMNPYVLIKGGIEAFIMMGALALTARMVGKGKKIWDAAGLLAMVLSIKLLMERLKDLSKFNAIKYVSGLIKMALMLSVMTHYMKKLQKNGKDMLLGAVAMTVMAYALGLAARSFERMGSLSLGDITKGFIVFGLLKKGITAMTDKMGQTDWKSMLKQFSAAAIGIIGIGLLALFVGQFFYDNPEYFAYIGVAILALGTIGIFMGAFALMAKCISSMSKSLDKNIKIKNTYASLIKFAVILPGMVAVAVEAAAISGLLFSAGITPDAILKAAAMMLCMDVMFVALVPAAASIALLNKYIGGSNDAKYSLKKMAEILAGIALAVIEIGAFILLTKALKFDQSMCDNAINVMIAIDKILLALAPFAVSIAIFSKYFEKINYGEILSAAIKVGEIIALTIVIVSLMAAILYGLGWFAENAVGFDDDGNLKIVHYIQIVGDVLYALGESLGKVVGGTLAGALTGFSPIVEQIKSLVETSKGLDENAANTVKTLVDILVGMSIAGLVDGVTNIVTLGGLLPSSNASGFASQLGALGEGVASFCEATKKSDFSNTENAVSAAKMIASLYDVLPKESGWVQSVFGEIKGLDTFGTEMGRLGRGIAAFVRAIGSVTFDETTVNTATYAAEAVAGLYKKMPRTSGKLQGLIGEIKGLDTFGSEMEKLGSGIANFIAGVSGVTIFDKGKVDLAVGAASVIAALYKDLPRTGGKLQGLLGEVKTLDTFSGEMEKLGGGIAKFITEISGVKMDETQIDLAAKAATLISAVYDNLPETGGELQKFFGEKKTLATFALEMFWLAKGITAFYKEVSSASMETNTIDVAVSAAQMVADIYSKLPNQDGVFQDIFGQVSMSDFAIDMRNLGVGIKRFVFHVEGISKAKIDGALECVDALIQINDKINTTQKNGKTFFWDDDFNMDSFGNSLTMFASNLVSFYSIIDEGIPGFAGMTKMSAMITWVEDIVSAAESIWLTHQNDGTFEISDILYRLGQGIGELTNGMIGTLSTDITSEENQNAMNSATKTLVDGVIDTLGSYDNMKSFYEIGKAFIIGPFGLAAGMKYRNAYLRTEVLAPLMASARNVIRGYHGDFKLAGSYLMNGFRTGISDGTDITNTLFFNTMRTFRTTVRGYYGDFRQAGAYMMTGLRDGIQSNSESVNQRLSTVVSILVNLLNNKYGSFSGAGIHLVDGFSNGILVRTQIAVNAADYMARRVLEQIKAVFKINSPAKATEEAGMYVDMGFANGIMRYTGVVSDAAVNSGNMVLNAMQYTMERINQMAASDLTYEPTIRPVVDLTNVQNGVSRVNGLFNSVRSDAMYGYTTDLVYDVNNRRLTANSARASRMRDTSNADLIRTVNNIGSKMDDFQREITNMKIVMDTGATVGALHGPMNRRFGQEAVRKRRGN